MSSYNKFQLPPIKGTEVFPETIKSPPVVHASVEYLVDNENPVAPEVLEDRAKNLLTANGGTLGHFVQSQRQNYGNGITDFVKTTRSYPDFDVAYMNIQGRHEIITIHLRVDVRRHGVVEEEERDELCVAVFHDGNQVSYAPMSELDNPTGNASRRILDQSNWGTDILKTCQLKSNDAFSHIYCQLNGLTTGSVVAGSQFSITTNLLADERLCESDTSLHYPIMNVSDRTAFVANADVAFDDRGNCIDYTSIAPQYSVAGYKFEPFHISELGERSYGLTIHALTPAPIYTYVVGDAFAVRSIYPATFTSDGAPPYEEVSAKVFDTDFNSAVFYLSPTGWTSSTEIKETHTEQESSESIITNLNIPVSVVNTYGRLTTSLQLVSGDYTESIYEPPGARFLTVSVSWGFGSLTLPDWSYTAEFGWQFDTIWEPLYEAMHIIFPFGKTNWIAVQFTEILNNGSIPPYQDYFRAISMQLHTDYGVFDGQLGYPSGAINTGFNEPDRFPTPATEQYRGWLHVGVDEYLIQAFIWNNERYLYLNESKVNSILGVPVESIQTVLFDIPRSKIEQFQ